MFVLNLSCWWVDISTWTSPPQVWFHLSSSVLNNSFFVKSLITNYYLLASSQITFNFENAQVNISINLYLLSIIYLNRIKLRLQLSQASVNPPDLCLKWGDFNFAGNHALINVNMYNVIICNGRRPCDAQVTGAGPLI